MIAQPRCQGRQKRHGNGVVERKSSCIANHMPSFSSKASGKSRTKSGWTPGQAQSGRHQCQSGPDGRQDGPDIVIRPQGEPHPVKAGQTPAHAADRRRFAVVAGSACAGQGPQMTAHPLPDRDSPGAAYKPSVTSPSRLMTSALLRRLHHADRDIGIVPQQIIDPRSTERARSPIEDGGRAWPSKSAATLRRR